MRLAYTKNPLVTSLKRDYRIRVNESPYKLVSRLESNRYIDKATISKKENVYLLEVQASTWGTSEALCKAVDRFVKINLYDMFQNNFELL